MTRFDKLAALALMAAVTVVPAAALASPSHPTAEDGEIWALYPDEGQGATLSYGTPETDNVAISLFCQRGEGSLRMALPLQAPPPRGAGARYAVSFTLHSGAVRQTFRGFATTSEEGQQVRDLRVPLTAPLIRAFRTSFTMGDSRGSWPARSAAERVVITRFLASCARR